MSDSVSLNTFPAGKESALAMLYLQNQDLSKSTPEEIADKYLETYNRIKEHFKETKKAGMSFLK